MTENVKARRPSARAEKSRAAIARAVVEMVREGHRQLTAPDVAKRAGVSERLVYHHFNDMRSLFVEANKINAPVVEPLLTDLLFEGTFEERRDYYVKSRAKAYEFVTNNRNFAYHHAYISQDFGDVVSLVWKREMAQISRVFAPEIKAFSGDERAMREANLHVIASWNYWNTLRNFEGLSVAKAKAALAKAITLTLTA